SIATGLRYVKQNYLGDNNNFSPRLSFAYAPDKKRKTVCGATTRQTTDSDRQLHQYAWRQTVPPARYQRAAAALSAAAGSHHRRFGGDGIGGTFGDARAGITLARQDQPLLQRDDSIHAGKSLQQHRRNQCAAGR